MVSQAELPAWLNEQAMRFGSFCMPELGITGVASSNVSYLVCVEEALILECVHDLAKFPRVKGMHSLNLHSRDTYIAGTRTSTPSV